MKIFFNILKQEVGENNGDNDEGDAVFFLLTGCF